MQKVDDRIRSALCRSAERCGSILALSRLLNVSHSTILCWLNGRIRNISTDLWQQKVFPVLEGELCVLAEKEMTPCEVRNFYLKERSSPEGGFVKIPLMKEQEMLSYRFQLESFASFAGRKAGKMILPGMILPSARAYYSVHLERLMTDRCLPWNTLVIFTENSRLADQDLVLLRIRDEAFLRICRFRSEQGKMLFEDIVSCKAVLCDQDHCGEELFRLQWVFPVAAIRFCCRKQDLFNNL